jgi:hypothetical protein
MKKSRHEETPLKYAQERKGNYVLVNKTLGVIKVKEGTRSEEKL